MAQKSDTLRCGIYCVRCGRTVVAADLGSQVTPVGGVCPGGCPEECKDLGPVADPVPGRRVEPAWAAEVRANLGSHTMGPPPVDIPSDMAGKFNLDKPFVELTLCEHGPYTGPTKGRVVGETLPGFVFLTHSGLYFVTWANLAFWTYLAES
jgi:hypothetical protein